MASGLGVNVGRIGAGLLAGLAAFGGYARYAVKGDDSKKTDMGKLPVLFQDTGYNPKIFGTNGIHNRRAMLDDLLRLEPKLSRGGKKSFEISIVGPGLNHVKIVRTPVLGELGEDLILGQTYPFCSEPAEVQAFAGHHAKIRIYDKEIPDRWYLAGLERILELPSQIEFPTGIDQVTGNIIQVLPFPAERDPLDPLPVYRISRDYPKLSFFETDIRRDNQYLKNANVVIMINVLHGLLYHQCHDPEFTVERFKNFFANIAQNLEPDGYLYLNPNGIGAIYPETISMEEIEQWPVCLNTYQQLDQFNPDARRAILTLRIITRALTKESNTYDKKLDRIKTKLEEFLNKETGHIWELEFLKADNGKVSFLRLHKTPNKLKERHLLSY